MDATNATFDAFARGDGEKAQPVNVPVFGLLKRGGTVDTAIIPDLQASTLIPIIRKTVLPDSTVYTDRFLV